MECVDVSWTRVAKIYWLIIWRGLLFAILGTLLVGFLLPVILSPFGVSERVFVWIARAIGALIGIGVGIIVTKMVFDKMFSDFEVVLVKPGSRTDQSDTQ